VLQPFELKKEWLMPTFSVIIPTYNRERFICEAIDSVLQQTFGECEILVVDDGSSDNTRTVLERYGNSIVYIYQENSGVSVARNTGIRRASGEWIAFLDSDDVWKKDYLSTQVAQIAAYPHAVAHIVNSVYVHPDGEQKVDHFEEIDVLKEFDGKRCLLLEKPFRVIVSCSHWFLQPIVMRRNVLMQMDLLDPDLSIAEDMDLLARISLKGPISLCRDQLVGIYRREESIANLSSQYFKRGIYSRKAFGKVYTNLMNLPQLTFAEKKAAARVLSTIWRALGNILLKSGKKLESRQYYRKSLFVYPSIASLVKYLAAFLPRQVSLLLVRKGKGIVPGEDAGGEVS